MMELDILGRKLHVQGATHELLEWLDERWHFPQYRGLLHSQQRVWLEYFPEPPDRWPQREPWTLETLNTHFEVRQEENQLWLGSGAWGVHHSLQDKHIKAWGHLEYPAQAALFLALTEALAATGLVYLHAAAAAQDGQATLFLGPSGRGKTSTLRKALESGWLPIAEDLVWLDPSSFQVFGWDKGVRVLPHDLTAWQQFNPGIKPGELVRGKYFFSYEQLGLSTPSCELRQIVLLERDATRPTSWLPSSPSETVMGLWQASGVPLSGVVRLFLQTTLPTLVQKAGKGRLVLGQGEPFKTKDPGSGPESKPVD